VLDRDLSRRARGDGARRDARRGVELASLPIAAALGTTLRGAAMSYCDGVRVRYERGRPASIEVLRA